MFIEVQENLYRLECCEPRGAFMESNRKSGPRISAYICVRVCEFHLKCACVCVSFTSYVRACVLFVCDYKYWHMYVVMY